MHNRATNLQQPTRRLSSLAAILNTLPLFVIAFAVLAAAPLHAQSRVPTRKVSPVYPPIAKQAGISGTVVIMATVDPSGKVIKADLTNGNKALAQAAIDAVKQWKFAPGTNTDILIVSVDFTK